MKINFLPIRDKTNNFFFFNMKKLNQVNKKFKEKTKVIDLSNVVNDQVDKIKKEAQTKIILFEEN